VFSLEEERGKGVGLRVEGGEKYKRLDRAYVACTYTNIHGFTIASQTKRREVKK
jgi:hypothetical protein